MPEKDLLMKRLGYGREKYIAKKPAMVKRNMAKVLLVLFAFRPQF